MLLLRSGRDAQENKSWPKQENNKKHSTGSALHDRWRKATDQRSRAACYGS